ncbi:hypothetical protein, partial [Escherichia coli]|uniref:hypothetical protein n=1 Tax=Escherichia coli TaxID=562 RepID=UPI001BC8991D
MREQTSRNISGELTVSYTHLTLPTNAGRRVDVGGGRITKKKKKIKKKKKKKKIKNTKKKKKKSKKN